MSEEMIYPETLEVGQRVKRGPGWCWGDQGGGTDGDIVGFYPVQPDGNGDLNAIVKWDNGLHENYRYCPADGTSGLHIVPADPPPDPGNPDNPWRKLLAERWRHFGWLTTQDVLRGPLTMARLGIAFNPEWDGLEPEALKETLAFALQTAHPHAATASFATLLSTSRDLAWRSRLISGAAPTQMRNETINIEVEVTEPRVRHVREWYEAAYTGELELDKDEVLDFVRNNDEDGLADYIREQIDNNYCDLNLDEGDINDSTTDDDESTGDGIEYARGCTPEDIADRLMNELADEVEEEDEE